MTQVVASGMMLTGTLDLTPAVLPSTAPIVTITSHASGATVSGFPTLFGTMSDTG